MTKVCTCCGGQKKGNETENLITFDQNLTLTILSTFFDDPHQTGLTFKVKYMTIRTEKKQSINVAVKWSREEHMCDPLFHFSCSMKACDETSKVISAFMDTVDTVGWKIKIVKPIVMESSEMELSVEPFVDGILHFHEISNIGRPALDEVAEILAAISHFSYLFSKGRYVITNLKCGIDEERMTITMISPTLLSNEQGGLGCDDLGSIQKYFFSEHVCNDLCEGMRMPKESLSALEEPEDSQMVFTPLKLK